ncbi:hypothetical protein [Streptacidiphilus sp. PAMC 29251]
MTDSSFDPSAFLGPAEWIGLENADGPAFPDTPVRLRELASHDFSAVASSLKHLHNSLLNDGVVYSATVPAFKYVVALLGDRLSGTVSSPPWEAERFPLRGELLKWLASVALDVSIGQEQRIREWGNYSQADLFPNFINIRTIYPEAFPVIASYFDDPDSRVVEAALVCCCPDFGVPGIGGVP